ncbi:carboxymuconolactone decarboxylase family protein [Chitinophaga ginsengisoli]|uniref:Alkylhydroperoxidase/carboxymuconolactone decarboxylase family protein YurZ n=1 Tax=Chitinophaga ginsengisoli TaxID=363837 RepID=A0A2P8GM16_9BACT|nr:carboxymuconolactone decarboxylase family protein [Chitinophaga ginsengisoli]PSL35000.1 alkylhydroperoxidase/carboxymuconolactone decarboxylase family protein YurZ [Chitinophaga ginsengisoli]
MSAQDESKAQPLNLRQHNLAAISALTATGDTERLKVQLDSGLDAGLTINEIKEALVQLYAYCGFPRSLNGISCFMQVLEERKKKGITDVAGREATPLKDSSDAYERGRKALETLTQVPQLKPAPGFGEFAPRIDAFLKEHLFADIFDSDVLDYTQRELVTISALAAMPGTEGQLQAHIGMGMNTGISAEQVKSVFDIIEELVSREQAEISRAVFSKMKK